MARNSNNQAIGKRGGRHSAKVRASGPQVGDVVAVISFCPKGGPPYYEGWAKILTATGKENYYEVSFIGDTARRIRFVHPDFQQGDPKRHFCLLMEMWRNANASNHSDFFPDSSRE